MGYTVSDHDALAASHLYVSQGPLSPLCGSVLGNRLSGNVWPVRKEAPSAFALAIAVLRRCGVGSIIARTRMIVDGSSLCNASLPM